MFYEQGKEMLFSDGDLDQALRAHLDRLPAIVDSIPKEQFLVSSDQDLIEHIHSKMIVKPIILFEDQVVMDQKESKVVVDSDWGQHSFDDSEPIYADSTKVTISLPFAGDDQLWLLKPNEWRSIFPRGVVRSPKSDGVGCLDIVIEKPSGTHVDAFKNEFESTLELIKYFVGNQKRQIEQFDKDIAKAIGDTIRARRVRLQEAESIAATLNIPLRRREGVPEFKPIPVTPKKVVKPLPVPSEVGYKPEPGIPKKDYDHMLSIIRHEGRTFEATPKTYAVHDEEELRDILLSHLNGHYQGAATGETFRKSGKTDIRIEDSNRAAFVAECKVWRGSKEVLEAVDQLLSYLIWRDCKAAIIIFNKHNAKFSEILQKVPMAISKHPQVLECLGEMGEGEWRYLMASPEDGIRKIQVHIFLFNIYWKRPVPSPS